jgi:hypothetical protein
MGGLYALYSRNNIAAGVEDIEGGRVWKRGTASEAELADVSSCSPTRFLHLAPHLGPHVTIDQWFTRECNTMTEENHDGINGDTRVRGCDGEGR